MLLAVFPGPLRSPGFHFVGISRSVRLRFNPRAKAFLPAEICNTHDRTPSRMRYKTPPGAMQGNTLLGSLQRVPMKQLIG